MYIAPCMCPASILLAHHSCSFCNESTLTMTGFALHRSSDDDSEEGELEMDEEQFEEQDEAPEEQQAAPPHSSSGISAVNGPSPVLGGSPHGGSPQGGSPRANSSNNRGFDPQEVPDLELEPEAGGNSLEEALFKQMEMQKKLHEQLEVRFIPSSPTVDHRHAALHQVHAAHQYKCCTVMHHADSAVLPHRLRGSCSSLWSSMGGTYPACYRRRAWRAASCPWKPRRLWSK